VQQELEVGSLQDLWLPNPASWSSAAANLLNNALAASTWKHYIGNLCQFKAYCLTNNIPFPPEQDKAIGEVASFLESATQSSQQPCSMIASLSASIGALYETTDFHPTHNPQTLGLQVCFHPQGAAANADLDPAIFTAKTFRKSGVMSGIHAGVEPDAIFCLGGWQSTETFYHHYIVQAIPCTYTDLIFDIYKADTDHLSKLTL